MQIKNPLFIFSLLFLLSHQPLWGQKGDAPEAPAQKSNTKDEQSRQILIDQAKLAMELAEKLMDKSKKELDNLKKMLDEANNIVTAQEVNRAEEEYERAVAAYEEAKLNLQKVELDSLKDAWHITIDETRRYEAKDGREMFSIRLKNSSLQVKLEESSKVLDKEVIVSAQIDDIFVSIKDQKGAIIAQPFEVRIPTLKEGAEKELIFELVKDEVEDVVVNLKYLDIEENRNIHLKQEEPYISVLSARRYKDKDRRRLELRLKYGAVLGGEGSASAPSPEKKTSNAAQEINNVYVSIQDETESIIGVPYEIRIPTLKDQGEQTLDFELRKSVDSIVVSLRYLDQEYKRKIHLEEDTRHISIIGAKKYRQGNQIRVTLRLKNTSTTESMPANATPQEIAAANEIRSIYVSLKDVDQTNIAQPYEQKIPLLGYNAETELTFQLQKDVDSIMVSLKYPDLEGGQPLSERREERDGWEVRVNFNVSLFDGRRTESHREAENAELSRLQLELRELQKGIQMEVRRAYREVATAKERVEIEQKRVAIFEQRLRTIERVLDEGLDLPSYRGLTFDDAFSAQAQFTEAQRVFYQARRDYAEAKEQLRQTMGWIQ